MLAQVTTPAEATCMNVLGHWSSIPETGTRTSPGGDTWFFLFYIYASLQEALASGFGMGPNLSLPCQTLSAIKPIVTLATIIKTLVTINKSDRNK